MLVRITSVIVYSIMTFVMPMYYLLVQKHCESAGGVEASRPDLSLCIFDATRPMSVQQTMWDAVKDTPKYFYVV